jgi:hypothetical protein
MFKKMKRNKSTLLSRKKCYIAMLVKLSDTLSCTPVLAIGFS